MAKDAYYFSHDSNAKDDPKCMLLIEELQLEGYGIYWVLIETLREQENFKYPLKMIPVLARKFLTTKEKMLTVINNYELFVIENGEFFYSESLNRRMGIMNNKREQARLAGKKSGEARRLKALKYEEKKETSSTDAERQFNECSTDAEQLKESKLKEKKEKINKNEIKENKEEESKLYFESDDKTLNLTVSQKEKLLKNKEDMDIDYYIERIVAYNETKPKSKKYKSLYLTLGDWIRRDIENNGKYVKVLKIVSNENNEIINDYSDIEFIGG